MPAKIEKGSLFENSAAPATGEHWETLLKLRNLHIERILSSATPAPGTYVQEQDEWVLLLRGGAHLSIGDTPVHLAPGEYVFLPAGTPHTVESTEPGTLWLAIHLFAEGHRD